MLSKLKINLAKDVLVVCGLCLLSVLWSSTLWAKEVTLSKADLKNKIKGAWAAQTIGVTYGFPVEFRYNSTIVPDSRKLPWYDGYLKETYEKSPGAYDDIYMDMAFVQVIEEEGLDAPVQSLANSFAKAKYPLWFANQVARYNVLNGIAPPQSGHWLNNPAADDIDFQIEADFIGIMSPGMINSATDFSDKVGHIMNYGDGWYGGVFVAAMYSQAFISDDIEHIINTALSVIPKASKFHQIISEVIYYHKKNPNDWKGTWFEIHKKWSDQDLGPAGADIPFNIDAKINAAWVVLGLLYGDGDFSRTMAIATRAGDDADCNPATAAGILGVIKGYEGIPEYWKQGLKTVEKMNFSHTDISLEDAYKLSYQHALKMVKRAGGSVDKKSVNIIVQSPKTVPLEVAFKNHYLKERRSISLYNTFFPIIDQDGQDISNNYSFDFEGVGFAVMGYVRKKGKDDYTFKAELLIDGKSVETAELPSDFVTRRFYLFWRYQLPKGKHKVEVKILNPTDKATVKVTGIAIYDDQPVRNGL